MSHAPTATRPRLTTVALRRWLPALLGRGPDLVSAYVIPGRVSPRLREATMLGVTSVNRCAACDRVHQRWARVVGVRVDGPDGLRADEAAAHAYGQAMASGGPGQAHPGGLSRRHGRELEAAAIVMELANLAGNRFLPVDSDKPSVGRRAAMGAFLYDIVMRLADRAGMRAARDRIGGGAGVDVLEVGIGTGLNLGTYKASVALHGIDRDEAALAVAARHARALGMGVGLTVGDAAAMPYPDASFDTVVGTFVLCTVPDVPGTLREVQRVLRPGGSLRFLEHARSGRPAVARLQRWLAPAWARVADGCRLDHDVRAAFSAAGLPILEARAHRDGLLVEIVAMTSPAASQVDPPHHPEARRRAVRPSGCPE